MKEQTEQLDHLKEMLGQKQDELKMLERRQACPSPHGSTLRGVGRRQVCKGAHPHARDLLSAG